MRDFMTRGGAISVAHLAELHRAADDLSAAATVSAATPAAPDPGTAAHGPPTQSHAGACEAWRIAAARADGEVGA